MENKTINTVFLGIIIILLAVGVWFLAKQTNAPTDTDQKPVVEEKTDPVVKKKTDPTPSKTVVNTVLQTIFDSDKNIKITECVGVDDGKIYYSIGGNAYDGGGGLVDSNGKSMGYTEGFTGKYIGTQVILKDCKNVYVVYPNIWGLPAVNTYNLK